MSQIKHIRRSKYGRPFVAGRRKRIWYPNVNEIIEINKEVIIIDPATKAERHEVYSWRKIQGVINDTKRKKGSIENKSAVLFRGLAQGHFFASANRRTAHMVVAKFIYKNTGKMLKKRRSKRNHKFIRGIRNKDYNDQRIERWLNGRKG